MNRREISVNVLLGLILVGAFFLLAAAYFGASLLGFYGIGLVAKHFLPSVGDDVGFALVLGVFCVTSVVGLVKKRFWVNALLALIVLAILLSGWLTGANHDRDLWVFLYPMILLFLIPNDRSLRAWEIGLSGSIAAAWLAQNTGLLGTGTAARMVGDCSIVGVFAWMAIRWRQNELIQRTSDTSSQVSS